MRARLSKLAVLAAIAAMAAVSGCASLAGNGSWSGIEQSHGARLIGETPTRAPSGLVAFCAREAGRCGTPARVSPAAREPSGGLQRDGARATRFHSLLAVQAGPGDAEQDRRLAYEDSAPARLSPAMWQELRAVNDEVNRAISSATDEAVYGVAEYWAMPISDPAEGPARGDCEDFALEKRARLIGLGWAPQALALAVAVAPRVGRHAVLVVQTDRGDFVLDNLHDDPRPLGRLNYAWVSRQVGEGMTTWASARVQSQGERRARAIVLASR